jgi:hypothetical protein
MQGIAARTLAAWRHLPDDAAELGARLLVKLSPPQWQLEWYLPRWLGESYGLTEEVTGTLVQANLTGLIFVCLQDKLVDEGFDPAALPAAICLGAAAHQQWIQHYLPLFEPSSPFWRQFDDYLTQWLHALAGSNQMPDSDFITVLHGEPGLLAQRAAPLKICCAAAADLAQRADLLAPLASTLDHLHVAAVLLDHAHDWREDLEAGRYNAFVHFASPIPQTLDQRALNRQRVHEELFLGDTGRTYFDHALRSLELAQAQAALTACPPLIAYLDWYRTTVLTAQDSLAQSARQVVEAAKQLIFGS